MKTDILHLNMFTFCYIFFSFALYSPEKSMNVYEWLFVIMIYTAAYALLSLLLINGQPYKPLTNMFMLIYLIFLISKQVNVLYKYIQLFHGKKSGISVLIVSIAVIIMLVKSKANLYKLAYPCLFMIMTLIFLIIILNGDKASCINLYQKYETNYNFRYKTLFDYLIPYIILKNSIQERRKINSSTFIIISNSAVILLVLLAFSCVSGNLVYSLSPLQMLFQISQTALIKNYDAIFNYFIFYAYFATIAMLITGYKTIKMQFNYFNNSILIIAIPFFVLNSYMTDKIFIVFEIIAVIFAFMGKRKGERL